MNILPNFLIIGAPRAGTTWIHKNISGHPEVFMSRKKETHFFDRHYDKGLTYYQSFFEKATNQKVIGEATPAYLHHPEVYQRIHQDLGAIKLIVSLRNPVDRLYLRYWNSSGKYKKNKGISFEGKIAAKPKFVEEGLYYDHLKKNYTLFPKENILILFFEEMKKDSQNFLHNLYTFLDVDPDYRSDLANLQVNSSDSKKLLVKNKSVYYLTKVTSHLQMKNISKNLAKENKADLPKMNPETHIRLINEVYRKPNEQLAKLIGKDLSHWNAL